MYEELKQILTDGETKVYLALLQLGSSTVGPIVEKSGVAYSNIYEILNRLIEKGLVSFVIKAKTKYFQAASPSNLIDFITKKEKKLEENKTKINKIIPKLEELNKSGEKLEAEIFIGIKGLKAAYEKFFKDYTRKKDYLWFYIFEKETVALADDFYIDLYKGYKFHAKGIAHRGFASTGFTKIAKKNEIRYVDFPIPSNIDIYEDKVMIVSWRPKIICFYINSKDIANKLKQYFYSVWKIAKK